MKTDTIAGIKMPGDWGVASRTLKTPEPLDPDQPMSIENAMDELEKLFPGESICVCARRNTKGFPFWVEMGDDSHTHGFGFTLQEAMDKVILAASKRPTPKQRKQTRIMALKRELEELEKSV